MTRNHLMIGRIEHETASTEGEGHPEDRGSLFHAVEPAISEVGAISGRVIQAFDRAGALARHFGP